MQAKDIHDGALLAICDVYEHYLVSWDDGSKAEARDEGCTGWTMYPHFLQVLDLPVKVVLAKAEKLIRRGLLEGCTCGCRGDFELTEAGREALAKMMG